MALASRCEFLDDNRYATDSGPRCPNGCAPEGETMWAFWVYPGQSSTAQCCSCHHTMMIQSPGASRVTPEGMVYSWPTIHEVKAALVKALTVKEYTQGSLYYLDPFQRWDYRHLRTTGREMVAYLRHLDPTPGWGARAFLSAIDDAIGGL